MATRFDFQIYEIFNKFSNGGWGVSQMLNEVRASFLSGFFLTITMTFRLGTTVLTNPIQSIFMDKSLNLITFDLPNLVTGQRYEAHI